MNSRTFKDNKISLTYRDMEHITSISNNNKLRAIYMTLYSYAKSFQNTSDKGSFFCTYADIPKISGINNPSTIKKYLDELIEMGLIEIVSKNYKQVTMYRCTNLLSTNKEDIIFEIPVNSNNRKKNYLKLFLMKYNKTKRKLNKIKLGGNVMKMKVFNNEEFGEVRTMIKDGEVWFVAKDVCEILELGNPSMSLKRLSETQKGVNTIDTLGGKQQMNIINESGLYKLAFTSRKPEAEKFTEWVTSEVLPSIRKHGIYATDNVIENILNNPDYGIKLLETLKQEREKRLEIENKLEDAKPKILFADSVSTSESTILIRDMAKILKQNGVNIGEKRLFAWLRENGYLIKQKGQDYNSPTQKSMNLKLFEIKETAINTSQGVKINKTPKVTGKGQNYFINKFLE